MQSSRVAGTVPIEQRWGVCYSPLQQYSNRKSALRISSRSSKLLKGVCVCVFVPFLALQLASHSRMMMMMIYPACLALVMSWVLVSGARYQGTVPNESREFDVDGPASINIYIVERNAAIVKDLLLT